MIDNYNIDRLAAESHEHMKRILQQLDNENAYLQVQINTLEARIAAIENSPYLKAADLICS